MEILYQLGIIGIALLAVTITIFPFYCYVIFRLISKAWHKSKQEEKTYG